MFHILNGGSYARHSVGFLMDRSLGLSHHVCLFIRSVSHIQLGNQNIIAKPNSILFIKSGTPYSYSNPDGDYIDDWIHFDCDSTDFELIPNEIWNQAYVSSNPSLLGFYIEQLLWEKNFAPEELRSETCHLLFHTLIKHCAYQFKHRTATIYNPYLFAFQRHRLTMQSAPYKKFSANEFATQIGISLSHYEHLYKQFFSVSFKQDLIGMRIDYAKELLQNTDFSVEHIARTCGYNSEVHFYRQFQSQTGITPREFRNRNRGFG